MSFKHVLAIVAGTGLFCWAASASAAPFSVYYRSSAAGPWTFYAGKDTKAAAQTTAAELKELGYLTEIISDAAPPPATVNVTAPASATIVNGVSGAGTGGTGYVGSSYAGGAGYSGSSSSLWSHAGSTVSSASTHHWDHHHDHHYARTHHEHHHPTHHPHHDAHHHDHAHHQAHAHHAKKPHHGEHGHHHGGHHAHHHGGHHQHHHAHHHSHGHHHK